MSICKHYQKLKVDKIANFSTSVKRVDFCQSHTGSVQINNQFDIWVCLDCGNQACSKDSEKKCSQIHSVQQKHRIAISLKDSMIYCFECENDLETHIQELKSEDAVNPAIKKLEDFVNKVKGLFLKFLQKASQTQILSSKPTSSVSEIKGKETKEVNKCDKLESVPFFIFGLINLGNTCFFNSVIQCLNGSEDLTKEYLDLQDFQAPIDIVQELSREETERQRKKVDVEEDNDEWQNCKSKKSKPKNKFTKNEEELKAQTASQIPPKKFNQLFQQLLRNGRAQSSHLINPEILYQGISQLFARFKTMEQQDAHDLLRCLLDALIVGEERWMNIKKYEEKKQGKLRNTITENIFGGYLSNYCNIKLKILPNLPISFSVKCLECQHVSRTFEFFLDLTLPIVSKRAQAPKKVQVIDILGESEEKEKQIDSIPLNNANINEEVKPPIQFQKIEEKEYEGCKIPYFKIDKESLYEPIEQNLKNSSLLENQGSRKLQDLLDDFCSSENLTKQTNYYKCEKCGQSQRALKKFFIYDPPKVLTLALKRFVQTGANRFEKMNQKVDIPEELDISSYTIVKGNNGPNVREEKKLTYKLFATVNHEGSMNQGHYTSFVNYLIKGQSHWFYFSDEKFYETTWKNVQASQAYILFYQRSSI